MLLNESVGGMSSHYLCYHSSIIFVMSNIYQDKLILTEREVRNPVALNLFEQ